MAYPPAKWERAQALFETGSILADIKKVVGIDKAAVSRRAKADGWVKGKNQPLVDKEVQARQALKEVELEKSKKKSTEVDVVDAAVTKKLHQLQFFETAHILVANTTVQKIRADGTSMSYQDLNAAANVITKAQEGILGKTPDTVINNTNASQTVINPTPEQLRAVNQQLEDAC